WGLPVTTIKAGDRSWHTVGTVTSDAMGGFYIDSGARSAWGVVRIVSARPTVSGSWPGLALRY
ncbi:MAG: hypothetical protein ACRCYU_05880, partial [Nocardioides sp.]